MDISAMRQTAGMTQEQLAEQMGERQTTISRLERQSEWKLSTLVAYMEGLDADVTLTVDLPNGGSVVYRMDKGSFYTSK